MVVGSIGRLHVLTDFHFQQGFSHAELARLSIEGGADTIQFRQKSGGIRHILREAKQTASVCHALGVPLLINDRLDAALACGASGVHLGQTDFPVHEARAVLGDGAIIGATATTVAQAIEAQKAGANYIGFGPVFPTASKANPASVKGLRSLHDVCRHVEIPVIAIAGITVQRIQSVIQAGAFGVAVMTAVTTARDPRAATQELRDAVDDALSHTQASSVQNIEDGRSNSVR